MDSNRPKKRSIGTWIAAAASIGLGLILLVSSYAKAVDPDKFIVDLERGGMFSFLGEGITSLFLAPAAYVLIAVEAALCLALLLVIRRPLVSLVATVMTAGFLFIVTYQYFYPPDYEGCGCFGNVVQMTPEMKIGTRVLFFTLAALTWLGLKRGLTTGWLRAVPPIAFVGVLMFAIAAPTLPIDGWWRVTNLNPGVQVADTKMHDVIPDLEKGRHFVVLLDRKELADRIKEGDEEAMGVITRLNELSFSGEVGVYALAEENEELEMDFYWTAGPAFEIHGAPYTMLRPLYRNLPRSFVVEDGQVVKVWNGIPEGDLLPHSRASKSS